MAVRMPMMAMRMPMMAVRMPWMPAKRRSRRSGRKMDTSITLHLRGCKGSSCATPHRQGSSTDPHSKETYGPLALRQPGYGSGSSSRKEAYGPVACPGLHQPSSSSSSAAAAEATTVVGTRWARPC